MTYITFGLLALKNRLSPALIGIPLVASVAPASTSLLPMNTEPELSASAVIMTPWVQSKSVLVRASAEVSTSKFAPVSNVPVIPTDLEIVVRGFSGPLIIVGSKLSIFVIGFLPLPP